ncbi:hypothetical protein D1013_08805 [Euzebyella marina]|uniref:FAD-dependent urate hydroxylase HpyO/Asp monooxygenase CreE-like FAD/NAD(P)-binding domain-containing protein n=1 Tax=Euzebyella marina TaxID=1761453 RepID=A0A3G2L5D4_9FLAO|nr:FAD/NAD(P)-binding protein [Euzebyella marina]AYN67453.1 hypothetical protein D1013_08805 [Euzebyella marina]
MAPITPYKIAIVGLGPKGLYALERLLSQIKYNSRDISFEINIYEKSGFPGAGFIYQPNQPDYLLMNYPNRKINAWVDEVPKSITSEAVSFVEWLSRKEGIDIYKLENGYSSRKTVGGYLVHCFNLLLRNKPDNAKINIYHNEVRDIVNYENGVGIYLNENGSSHKIFVNEVLLTTGHSSFKSGKRNDISCNGTFIPFVYPVEENLAAISERSHVGIKGMGLTFIDAVLGLTEGRGGRFELLANGNYKYHPSGKEPSKIFPFSRSGMLMVPRTGIENKIRYTPKFFTLENIFKASLSENYIHFIRHILPLYVAETRYRYYSVITKKYSFDFEVNNDLEKMEFLIKAFHQRYPNEYKFVFGDLFKTRAFVKEKSKLNPVDYLNYIVQECKKGSHSSGFMAAALTWGDLSEIFNRVFSFSGLSGDSHFVFDKKYRSKLNRISYGPPLANMEKVLSLVQSGIIDFSYCIDPTVVKKDKNWEILSLDGRNRDHLDVLIDARIPTAQSTRDWGPLFTNMRQHGILRSYVNHNDKSYDVGCPEIDRQGKAISTDGESLKNISIYGTPTEGVVYDNDTLSRKRNNFASIWATLVLENASQEEMNFSDKL